MKTYRFRHPGMSDVVAEVAAPEMSDLSDVDLKRLVLDFRRRLMIRDTALTVVRFYFSPMISQTMWATLWRAAVEESHSRAVIEHLARGFLTDGSIPGYGHAADVLTSSRRQVSGLGALLRQKMAGASDTRPAQRDGERS